jgi:hypothetical protein
MSDGIEIHFDQKRGRLDLACEPEAFARYRELAREDLREFPGISMDRVAEICIVDVASYAKKRGAPKGPLGSVLFGLALVVILALAVIGAMTVLNRVAS